MRWLRACLRSLSLLLPLAAMPANAADEPPPALKGLVFVPGASALDRNGAPASESPVDLSRIELLNRPDFANRMRLLIGQPLTMATLNQIAPLATEVFTAAGHPAVDITIPEQDVTTGVVQVVVTEFKVGHIVVEGAKYFPAGLYIAASGVRPDRTVDMGALQAGLGRINASEYRNAESALRPGTEPGTVDVVLQARDRLPVTVSAGYNNTGSLSTGRNQWTVGISVANTFGDLDDVLGYQYLTSDFQNQVASLVTHSVNYSLNIPGAGQFSMAGSYALNRPPVDAFVSSHGTSAQLSPRFTTELLSGSDFHMSIRTGYDYKTTNNNLAFGGTTITQTAANVSQFELASVLGQSDKLGRTDGSLSFIFSPGGMVAGNDDSSFRGLSPQARARYAYVRLDGTRYTTLSDTLTLWTHAVGQIAGNALLPGEQLNAGGVGTVRGYLVSTVRGDAGLMVSNELRWSAGGVSSVLGHDIGDRYQPFLFVDYAEVKARPASGHPASDGALTSFGPGIRVNMDRYLQLTLDAGAQVRVASGRHYGAQFFDFSVNVQY